MSKIIEFFDQASIRTDWKTQYIRYRLGRLKHQYWLWNRKNTTRAIIDQYDHAIIKNCQSGKTVFFASAGYYMRDIFTDVEVVEMHPVVQTFYPEAYICTDRAELSSVLPFKADNFAVVNNRADIWTELENVTMYCDYYTKAMSPGCRFFYSFRDTQISGLNRLTTDMESHFLNWAKSLQQSLGLTLVWHSIDFSKKTPDHNGYYDQLENPDTTNGNLKFWFVYQGDAWIPIV
jgi:hypothetical protein